MKNPYMRAALLDAPGTFSIQTQPQPVPVQGEVLLRIEATGICASDVHYYCHGAIGGEGCSFPQHLGHETAGVVVEAPGNTDLTPGTRVAVEPGKPCGRCEQCRRGHYNRCPFVRFLGSPGMPGAFAEYLVVTADQCEPVPSSMSSAAAAMLEPLGVAVHALSLARLRPGADVAVWGTGAVGLCVCAMARICGAGRVIAIDPLESRLACARCHMGADVCINPRRDDPHEAIKDSTGGRGVDVACEAAGESDTLNSACGGTAIGGMVLCIGIPPAPAISLDPHLLRRRELTLQNVRRSNAALRVSLDLARRHAIALDCMATHRFPLDRITEGFEYAANYRDNIIRAIVTPETHP